MRTYVAADRFVDAQLWWVASELCRRHSRLRLQEFEHDEIGTYVEVLSWPDSAELRMRFSRVAGIQIHGHDEFRIAPAEVVAAANPHDIVKRLEVEHGIGGPGRFPPTTPQNIGLRAIAQVLAMMVNSRYSWTVRGERPGDPSVVHGVPWFGAAAAWPSIVNLRENWGSAAAHDALYQSAPAHAWVLMRDLEPVAVFDRFGCVHTERGKVDLCRAYAETRSNLAVALARVLGRVLST